MLVSSRRRGRDGDSKHQYETEAEARQNSGAKKADDQVRNDQSLFPTKLIGVTSTIATA
jgi:hypothetical protein